MTVPKLRFKEFDEDWNLSSLANISSIITGNTPSTSNREYYDGEFLFVSPADIQENRYIEKTKTTLTANGFSKCRHIPENSVLFVCIGSTIGKVAQNKVICATNQQINAVIPKKGYSSDFLYLQLERLAPKIKLNAGVQAVPLINKTEFGKTLLNTPIYIEQTKIAAFLSTVDEKISQLSQKHELLSQYKQGMMQKLFSQQIRFKANDGSEFGEWGKVKFSESFVFHNTNSYSRALLSEVGEVMNIHYGDIHTKFSMLFDVSKEIVPFLNDQIDSTKIAENQFLKEGDLVIADASEDYKDIGKAIEVVHLNNQKVVAGLHTYIARPVQPFALGFCGYLMQTFEVREQIKKLATGTSVLGISKTNIGKVEIKLPSLEEQTKIANFLSSIDQKIDVVSEQLEQAKLWKKGLLQQMFV